MERENSTKDTDLARLAKAVLLATCRDIAAGGEKAIAALDWAALLEQEHWVVTHSGYSADQIRAGINRVASDAGLRGRILAGVGA